MLQLHHTEPIMTRRVNGQESINNIYRAGGEHPNDLGNSIRTRLLKKRNLRLRCVCRGCLREYPTRRDGGDIEMSYSLASQGPPPELGYLWVSVGICGYLWVSVGICGYLWVICGLSVGYLWVPDIQVSLSISKRWGRYNNNTFTRHVP
jgi:hypothetical protein